MIGTMLCVCLCVCVKQKEDLRHSAVCCLLDINYLEFRGKPLRFKCMGQQDCPPHHFQHWLQVSGTQLTHVFVSLVCLISNRLE